MTQRSFVFTFGIVLVLVLASSQPAAATLINFTAFLEGAQEVPAVQTPAKGIGLFTLDNSANTLNYQIIYTGSLLSSSVTGVDLDLGAQGTVGTLLANLTPTTTPLVGEVSGLSAQNEADLLAGNWYVNLETTVNVGGEIRGQLIPGNPQKVLVPEPSSMALLGLGLAGLAAGTLRRRRRATR